MRMDKHQTWGTAVLAWAVGADRPKSARVALVVVLVVGLGVGLSPGVVQAHHYGSVGVGGAQLKVDPDGYDKDQGLLNVVDIGFKVSGTGFAPLDVAQVFQCEEGAEDLHAECQLVATQPTSRFGSFLLPPTELVLRSEFVRPVDGETRACLRGPSTDVQCSLVAATYGPDPQRPGLRPTSRADHLICFSGNGGCKDKSTTTTTTTTTMTTTTTTTTTIPPRVPKVSMSEDGYDGYYPGERLTTVAGDTTDVGQPAHQLPPIGQLVPHTPPIDVYGRDFPPSDVVEVFQCKAGVTGSPRVSCILLGTALSSRNGEFTATVSLRQHDEPSTGVGDAAHFVGKGRFRCRGVGEDQCSVVAATFIRTDPDTDGAGLQPTSRGENYVCFEGPHPCANKPGAPVPTTTTTTIPVPPPEEHRVADFDGNGSTDISVFRPSEGMWYVKDGALTAWGTEDDIPVPGDYDGDGAADLATFRPETGQWAVRYSGGDPDLYMTYGMATDIPVVADYDGDKKADIAVFRTEDATWRVHRSSDGIDTTTFFGLSTDIPTPGYYDGDDMADLGVYRDGTWFVLPSAGGSYTPVHWGLAGDIPLPADYDADPDETTEFAVFRPSEGAWYVLGAGALFHGLSGDVPVPGHYDADPRIDVAVFRPSSGQWFIHDQPTPISWGLPGDIPLPLPAATYHRFF